MVVEDDPDLRGLLKAALSGAGYTVVAVEDGVDALRRVEREVPSAVVLDMALPRLDGRDVQRELSSRPHTRDIPIVVVSGTDISDLNPANFACVLRKPVRPETVVFAVEDSLRRSGRLA